VLSQKACFKRLHPDTGLLKKKFSVDKISGFIQEGLLGIIIGFRTLLNISIGLFRSIPDWQ